MPRDERQYGIPGGPKGFGKEICHLPGNAKGMLGPLLAGGQGRPPGKPVSPSFPC